MKKIAVLVCALCLVGVQAKGASIDFGFNDFSAQAQIAVPLVKDDYGTSKFNGRFLYNDDEDTTLGSVGFDFVGEPGNLPGLELGIGAQGYWGEADDNQDLLAFGIGGKAAFFPPALAGIGFSGKVFYAPHVLSFMDSERLLETGIRASYAVIPKVRLYAEYQNIRTDFDDHGDWTIDEGLRIGFEAEF